MAQQTPKHKAKELYDYYLVLFSDVDYVIARKKAKMCVRKAVDEILDNNCGSHTDESNATNNEIYCDEYFWQQVKTELENL